MATSIAAHSLSLPTRRTGLLARYPLTFFFLFAYGGTWLVWSYFILSQEGTKLLDYHCRLEYLSVIALGTAVPALSALLMNWACEGAAGVRRLLSSCVWWRVGVVWYLVVLVGIPLAATIGTLALPGVWSSRTTLTAAEVAAYVPFFFYPVLLIGGPLGEEPGWRGFALPRLQERFGPVYGSLVLGPLWALWHWPIWFSGQWTEPTLANIGLYVAWLTAITFVFTWVCNHTRGSVWMAILAHTSMDAFPNAILWPLFPAAAAMTASGFLYGYLGLLIGFGAAAVLLVAFARWRTRPD